MTRRARTGLLAVWLLGGVYGCIRDLHLHLHAGERHETAARRIESAPSSAPAAPPGDEEWQP